MKLEELKRLRDDVSSLRSTLDLRLAFIENQLNDFAKEFEI
jgi:hypothetical protein